MIKSKKLFEIMEEICKECSEVDSLLQRLSVKEINNYLKILLEDEKFQEHFIECMNDEVYWFKQSDDSDVYTSEVYYWEQFLIEKDFSNFDLDKIYSLIHDGDFLYEAEVNWWINHMKVKDVLKSYNIEIEEGFESPPSSVYTMVSSY
ncbi:MAG: hypothetical protein CL489_10415 [Acidobacteria bacterium]|nr:hypothetical protein [Acidobacteriota bacterium]|tara:strand:+ start:19962 stop:20405 length:444 start_codon:yes stop_codon:yes gene_type:complete